MTNPKVSIIAQGIYKSETVDVLDVLYYSNSVIPKEYQVNYGGPVWVSADDIDIKVWYI